MNKKSSIKDAVEASITYCSEKFNDAKVTVSASGSVTVEEGMVNMVTNSSFKIKYRIDPAQIKTGLIDDDDSEDAIVYIYSANEEGMENIEHLILIRSNGKLILSRAIEANMKVFSITDRVITAEVSTRSVNSPLRDCHVCKEVVKYKFKSGDLVIIQP